MNTRRRLALALGLVALMVAGGIVALRTIPAGAEEPKAEPKAEKAEKAEKAAEKAAKKAAEGAEK